MNMTDEAISRSTLELRTYVRQLSTCRDIESTTFTFFLLRIHEALRELELLITNRNNAFPTIAQLLKHLSLEVEVIFRSLDNLTYGSETVESVRDVKRGSKHAASTICRDILGCEPKSLNRGRKLEAPMLNKSISISVEDQALLGHIRGKRLANRSKEGTEEYEVVRPS